MEQNITAYPLYWPEGWDRNKEQVDSKFGTYRNRKTLAAATHFLLEELRRMGVDDRRDIIISTNVVLRNDGLPRSGQKAPEDPGVSVWWIDHKQEQKVIALDKYKTVADNLYAVAKTIEALRGIERWGGGEILNRTFKGFKALPSSKPNWRAVLQYDGQSLEDLKDAYRKARSRTHPDKGGSAEEFKKVCDAWNEGYRELTNAA